jgi:hypothetical protein
MVESNGVLQATYNMSESGAVTTRGANTVIGGRDKQSAVTERPTPVLKSSLITRSAKKVMQRIKRERLRQLKEKSFDDGRRIR